MKLIAATTDISSKDLPLRDDVRLLGRILGETLRDQEGEASYQLIENVRRAAVRFRKTQDDRDRGTNVAADGVDDSFGFHDGLIQNSSEIYAPQMR